MNGTSDIKIEDHHNHEKDNIKVIRDFDFFRKCKKILQQKISAKNVAIKLFAVYKI